MKNENSIESLAGELLSGVAFVHDYVEFHFDGRIVRALADPSVSVEGKTYRFPHEGSRDALCSIIGKTLGRVDVHEGQAIALVFSSGAVIRIPLGDAERTGPEAAHFVPGKNLPLQIW